MVASPPFEVFQDFGIGTLLVFVAASCCGVSPLQAQFQAGSLLPTAGMLVGPELLPVLSVRNVD